MLEDLSASNAFELVAPTARLPSIKDIRSTPLSELRSCVEYLRFLYNPEVRGSQRRKSTGLRSDGLDRLKVIRADAFERSHAIRWLTSLVARGDELVISEPELFDGKDEKSTCESLIGDAASLLAACSGTAGSGRLSRSYTFGPSPKGEYVSLTLADAPFENGDYGSVGAQTWGGACVMTDMVFENPDRFGLPLDQQSEGEFRILELGAGTGLVGLAVAKLSELRNVRSDIVLTDFHPSVLANLRGNVASNFPPGSSHCVNVSVAFLDWSLYVSTASSVDKSLGVFDLVFGADIVYEYEHAFWIRTCLEKLLRPSAYFHLVIPLRRTHTAESNTVEEAFGESAPESRFVILHHERFSCDPYVDASSRTADGSESDEVEYSYFRIGWKAV